MSAHLTKETLRAYEESKVDMMLAKLFDTGKSLQLAMSLLTKKRRRLRLAPGRYQEKRRPSSRSKGNRTLPPDNWERLEIDTADEDQSAVLSRAVTQL